MNSFGLDSMTSFVEHGQTSASTVDYSSTFLETNGANAGRDTSYLSSSVSPLSSRALTPAIPAALALPSQAFNTIMSMRGTMAVHNFDPKGGPSTTVLSVRLNFRSPFPDIDVSQFFLRVCIDDAPLPTKMIQRGGSAWELRALIPEQRDGKGNLKLSIQAFHTQEIIDVAEFGFYTILGNTEDPTEFRKRGREDDGVQAQAGSTFAPSIFSPSGPPLQGGSASSQGLPNPPKRRKANKASLVRTSQLDSNADLPMQDKVNLIISGDLGTMSTNWTEDEFESRRRLVQFRRVQEGSNIRLTFTPVDQDEYVESNIVVSCILRHNVDDCYITSVDIIYLLEAIVGNRFSVEEKNRIRRNLEGFKPMTVSKSKSNSDFFSLIMGFPHPRPRNIEKDVKVFSWKLLKKALEKIVGKYSYLPSSGSLVEERPQPQFSSSSSFSSSSASPVWTSSSPAVTDHAPTLNFDEGLALVPVGPHDQEESLAFMRDLLESTSNILSELGATSAVPLPLAPASQTFDGFTSFSVPPEEQEPEALWFS